ncbi:hypothetical protein [Ammoniphilus resinae]|uniref:Pimeloyl-ACP methyl ester carboxylesterase n=1 Tax=Ammoniphilus resinae TaxID=861532 RepID=A0ABS4GPH4_9BACL|nr:hypothetical protein [Ammoniphilus resinae]MBP1932174.1 pimeloyl-ACP methyl ester carboxylesterase [Ammoniphilus resinae]
MDDSMISLKDMGSFHIGGREIEVKERPVKEVVLTKNGVPVQFDPNGTYQVEQMYVQYFIPRDLRGKIPLLLWHGGSLTGATYETTPDGREGWLNYFLKRGWAVYNSDAVERGRSGWSLHAEAFQDEPIIFPKKDQFERFRIGAGKGSYNKDRDKRRILQNNQFPVEYFDDFTRQIVPRWAKSDDATLAAYMKLVEKIGPCIIVAHSQAGPFAFRVAQALPDQVKAIIAVEPANGGDTQYSERLKNTPILTVYGDYISQDERWTHIRGKTMAYFQALRSEGGMVDILDLPELGITGNSHLMMMDRNNLQIARAIQEWLEKRGFYR